MKHKICAFALFFTLLIYAHSSMAEGIVYPDFSASMLRERPNQDPTDSQYKRRKELYAQRNPDLINLFRNIYERNSAAAKKDLPISTYRIPKIIHQIWIGSNPIPELCLEWMRGWAELNGWTYKLWTDKEVAELAMYNRELYDSSRNFGEKSDILRLEILYQFGGIYADVDYECLRPEMFEELNKSYDFYIGFDPVEHGHAFRFNMFHICNALMASCVKHPLLNELIVNLKANYYAYKNGAGVVERTGPSYLTRIICSYERSDAASKKHRNIYLPTTFFYPFSILEIEAYFKSEGVKLELFPETVGNHYWKGTWRSKLAMGYY